MIKQPEVLGYKKYSHDENAITLAIFVFFIASIITTVSL